MDTVIVEVEEQLHDDDAVAAATARRPWESPESGMLENVGFEQTSMVLYCNQFSKQ